MTHFRTSRKNMQVPIDVIDLTEDSPSNPAIQRLPRRSVIPINASHNNQTAGTDNISNSSGLSVVNLDDTIQETPKSRKKINESRIKNVPSVVDSPNKEPRILTCPVCFEILTPSTKPMSTFCGHLFCFQCLQKLLTSTKKCAICQSVIKEKKCIRLHI